MREAVRYQFYRSRDGFVLFMASEQAFWRRFCGAVGREDLFERNPGARVADHARGNTELRRALAEIFAARTTAEWIELSRRENLPIAPVNDAQSIAQDPQFRERLPWLPREDHGTDLMPSPIRWLGEPLPAAAKAPVQPGQDTEAVLREVLGYDDARINALRIGGCVGGAAADEKA